MGTNVLDEDSGRRKGGRGEGQGDRVRERAQRGRELSRFEVGGAG